jgi:hypothetical protein
MAITYSPIATNTLGTATAEVTFSSISGGFTDLVVIQTFPNDEVYGYTTFRYNGDTSSNYSLTTVYGYTTATSGRESNVTSIRLGTSSYMSNGVTITNIQNYSNTTTYKTSISRYNFGQSSAGMQDVGATVGLWRSTSAITSITLLISSGTYPAGSTFTLYGIKAA